MLQDLKRSGLLFSLIVLVMVWAESSGFSKEFPVEQTDKVDSWVREKAAAGKTEFLVFLTEQADLSGAEKIAEKAEKGFYVYRALTEAAARTQGPVIHILHSLGVEYRPFWIANMVWVRGNAEVVDALAAHPDVARVHANPEVRQELPSPPAADAAIQAPAGVEWNIAKVNAPSVWDAGFRGQGTVVAGQDTGYQWDHPALKNQYRGWNGSSANHDYNWHDAIHSGGINSCPANSPTPCDDYGHGTHTMGTMVGDDGAANQIGMAPGARWIGCRNMNSGVGTPATYAECFQWFLAPTRINGSGANPAMAPDVINNSWSCPASEGCSDPNVLRTVVNNVRAAGILTVQSAGNQGSGCSTIADPAAIYDASFTVGSTDTGDVIAGTSSRGPVIVDGSNRLKPDISAPGVGIRSCVPTGAYQTMSGTSMAAPHVAALAALLLSANSRLSGQVDLLENFSRKTALQLLTNQGCGGDSPSDVPNNVYGWGRLEAHSAFQQALATGALKVTLEPSLAVTAGGRWRVDGGAWKTSGQSVTALKAGAHAVELMILPGWASPVSLTAIIRPGQTTRVAASYRRSSSAPWLPLLLEDGLE
jgi:serine protease AprX